MAFDLYICYPKARATPPPPSPPLPNLKSNKPSHENLDYIHYESFANLIFLFKVQTIITCSLPWLLIQCGDWFKLLAVAILDIKGRLK